MKKLDPTAFTKTIILLFAINILYTSSTDTHQTYPGTTHRPILSAQEAALLTQEHYFAAHNSQENDWTPEIITLPATPDFTVGKTENYTSIQDAVNEAVKREYAGRQYIMILEGVYRESVYIPPSNGPLTIYGSSDDAAVYKVVSSIGASMNGSEYSTVVNPNGTRYKKGDPSWDMYQNCAVIQTSIGTFCTSVFWNRNPNVQLFNLNIENESWDGQSIALTSESDMVHIQHVQVLGHQDTLFLSSLGSNRSRVYVNDSWIFGDVDYVFGNATVVFNRCDFFAVSDRHGSSYVFAPSTLPNNSYGFLVQNSYITGDPDFHSTKKVSLGRAWDSSVKVYVPGVSPNGQVLIKNTQIDGVVNVTGPWHNPTFRTEFVGNIDENRDLDDGNFNRMWEYDNYGDGA